MKLRACTYDLPYDARVKDFDFVNYFLVKKVNNAPMSLPYFTAKYK